MLTLSWGMYTTIRNSQECGCPQLAPVVVQPQVPRICSKLQRWPLNGSKMFKFIHFRSTPQSEIKSDGVYPKHWFPSRSCGNADTGRTKPMSIKFVAFCDQPTIDHNSKWLRKLSLRLRIIGELRSLLQNTFSFTFLQAETKVIERARKRAGKMNAQMKSLGQAFLSSRGLSTQRTRSSHCCFTQVCNIASLVRKGHWAGGINRSNIASWSDHISIKRHDNRETLARVADSFLSRGIEY